MTTAEPRVLVIRPTRGWGDFDPREMWRYRDLVAILALRDLKLRYRQTLLGVLWVVLQPLMGALILAFVFGRVAGLDTGGPPYLQFAFAGVLYWALFSTIVSRATTSLIQSPQLVSKVFFPRLLLPLSVVPAALVDFSIGLATLLVLMTAQGHPPHPSAATSLFWVLPVVALAAGVGFFAASLAAIYRDVAHVTPVLLQFLMFASPVAYGTSAWPSELRGLLLLNPLAPLIDGFRTAVLGMASPPVVPVAVGCALSLLVLLGGVLFFGRRQRLLADVI